MSLRTGTVVQSRIGRGLADPPVTNLTTTKLDGRGRLSVGGDVVLASVTYHLLLWEHDGAIAVQLDGWIEIQPQVAQRMISCPLALTLVLEDGQALEARILDTRGRICVQSWPRSGWRRVDPLMCEIG